MPDQNRSKGSGNIVLFLEIFIKVQMRRILSLLKKKKKVVKIAEWSEQISICVILHSGFLSAFFVQIPKTEEQILVTLGRAVLFRIVFL